jgi:hypothetical protein
VKIRLDEVGPSAFLSALTSTSLPWGFGLCISGMLTFMPMVTSPSDRNCTPKLCDHHNNRRICTEFAIMLGLIKSAHHSLMNSKTQQLICISLGLINSVKSPASAANPPLSGIDSGNYNNKQEAACNLINYKKSELINLVSVLTGSGSFFRRSS